ncbi:MAG: branched-chain amino acid ABC transporter permease [Actinobacteria bacterium]|nr:branched-chain amino acid ABC transporter permease [Actinomycetota bacterium]
MADFLQQVVSGLATGGIYASLALAIVLIHRATRVVNFAQGEMAMVTTYVAWTLIDHGVSYWLSFVLTLALAFVGGVLVHQAVMRPFQDAPVVTAVMVTIGLFILLNGLAAWIWSSEVKAFPSAFSTRPIDVGGVVFSLQDLGVIAVSLGVVAGLFALFRFTKAGLALRAAAFNPATSRLAGVPVGRMLAAGWGLAAVLGAVSGMMVAPSVFLDPNMMRPVLLYALAAAVLGGLDSPLGALVAGLLLGVLLNLLGAYVDFVGTDLRLPVALAIILAVLLVRPAGLFGSVAARRV